MRSDKVTTEHHHIAPTTDLMVALVERCAGKGLGRAAAIERLLEIHRPWILRRCARWLRSRADAEDVAQEVLIRVCASLGSLEQHGRFRPWLARIVDNQCKTFLKRNQRWVTVGHVEALIDLMDAGALTAPQEPVDREGVTLAMGALPDTAREVLVLRFFHDQSLEQIARNLDVSLSAAKMRLYRALERFAVHYRAIEA